MAEPNTDGGGKTKRLSLRGVIEGVMVSVAVLSLGGIITYRDEFRDLKTESKFQKVQIEALQDRLDAHDDRFQENEKKMLDGERINAKIDGLAERLTELSGLLRTVLEDRLRGGR